MDLSNLKKPEGATKARKRKGRGPGSGNGKTAGRGEKGQNARSGGRVHPRFEGGQMPIHRRLPKFGFHNRGAKRVAVVNISDLERVFSDGATVSPEELEARGMVKGRWDQVKVLGNGELSSSLIVRVHKFSKSARDKIEAAGGTAEVI